MQESGGTVLAKLMYRVLSVPFLCTPMTGGYGACVGRVGSMWPALKLYDAVADAMLWILEKSDGVDGFHYLDDFLVFGAPDSRECWPGVHSWECLWSLGR